MSANKRRELFAGVFFKVCAKYGKKYCWVSMGKVRKLCKKWYGVEISERAASLYMSQLVKDGCFERMKRQTRGEDGRICAKSSLTFLKEGVFKMVGKFRGLVDALNRLSDAPKYAYNLSKRRERYHPPVEKRGFDTSVGKKDDAPFSFIPPKFVLP